MTEPSGIVGASIATGITVFGVSTGLDPAVLLAGLAGGIWAQSYHPPTGVWRRVALATLASLLAGYLAPVLAALAASSDTVRGAVAAPALQLPTAVIVGLTAHRVLGPAFMRLAARKSEEFAK